MRFVVFFVLMIFVDLSFSQKWNGQLGVVLNVGSHVNNIGLSCQLGFHAYFVQTNLFFSVKLNFQSYGNRKMFVESRSGLGLVLLGGKKDLTPDFHLDGLNHNTAYRYGVGYNYLIYRDNSGSSQLSGGWGLHLTYFSLMFENDVFGGQAKDRFRTGAFQLSYRRNEFKFFTNLYMWTGETKNSIWVREKLPGCPNGYRSLENLPFGRSSHGILSAGIHVQLPYYQFFTAKVGIDSEQIRHVVQNKLAHDLIFMPKKYPRNTPHYPRLNAKGQPVFVSGERKKDKPFIQVNLNEVWSN